MKIYQPIKHKEPMEFTRYKLKGFLMKQYKENSEFKMFENHIKEVGFLSLKLENYTAKVYTPELAFIFGLSNIQARNLDLKTDTIINGKDFIKSFIEGFKEGENYFETEFSIDAKTLYGQNSELYVQNIHSNFFHVIHSDQNYKGWNFVKCTYPILISEAIIKKYGFYSGIVSSVEGLIKKHPVPFADFYNCKEMENSSKETEQEPPPK